ncbi:uncharacterized protein JN550_001784 [Neoarthrinium moseri]|uniref:uncharacterized protein n=1 Tax=Neoarthrinium moseri TaxID=1658444 RepID=UPI001FDC066C|nr:uncharacterized protein JN550_001784 [Neoarthrinium moseri]KAI1876288.1 hypothetical protein JN550_001784 [Neoarthrinium moseri]
MTSLEFIMDMDVDEEPKGNKKDGASSIPGSRRDRDLASDHANPGDHRDRLTTAPKQRRGTSGRHTKSSTAAASSSTASSSSTARPAPARRHSNTSNDDHDDDDEEMYAHTSGSGSGGQQPNRPMGNPPGAEIPIKLTPITGRVSRAKKGVPVHTCDICRPPKTFTRAEHLRRHQLSHQTPGYPCTYPGCDRAFHRADLLARHATRHEQDVGDRGSSTGGSRRPSTPSMSDGYGMPHPRQPSQGPMAPQAPAMQQDPGSSYGTPSYHYNTSGGGSTPMSPPQARGRQDSYQSTNSSGAPGYTLSTQIPTIQQPSLEGSPNGEVYHYYHTPRTEFRNLQVVTQGLPIPDNNPGLLHPNGSPWESNSDSNFSTPSNESYRRSILPGYETPTSASEYHVGSFVPSYPPSSQDLEVMTSAAPYFSNPWSSPPYSTAMMDPVLSIYQEDSTILDHTYPPFSSVRSPTPPIITSSVQSAESLVTLAPFPDAQAVAGRYKDQAALLGTLSGAAFLTAVTLPRPVRNAVPDFLEVYWRRFDTLFPLVHRRTFEAAPNEVLRCAMAAVATQFLDGKEDRLKGNQLHEWAWQEVRRIPQWNVQTMQAILLCEFFARFRGRKAVIRPSSPFQSLYSRDHLFSLVLSSPFSQWHPYSTSPSQVDTTQDPESSFGSTASTSTTSTGGSHATTLQGRWAEWIEAEARRRLLAACFVLDVHTSVYYELPLMQPFTNPCPPIPLTAAGQALWTASTPGEWETLRTARYQAPEPAVLTEDIITPERIANAPPLDQAVFLASEALRLPKTSGAPAVDFSRSPDLSTVERLLMLFPGSAVANTYAALHYTPLHDLLAVSGDSWLFTQKVLPSQSFQQHQKQLKQWSSSPRAAVAAKFASRALLAFLNVNANESHHNSRAWNKNDISDYWAVYVCALICWALGYQATRGTNTSSKNNSGNGTAAAQHDSSNVNEAAATAESEAEALRWLHMVAGFETAADILASVNLGGRRVIIAVVAMVKRRLEVEAIGGRSRLLVDALGVLRKLEEGVNWKWF